MVPISSVRTYLTDAGGYYRKTSNISLMTRGTMLPLGRFESHRSRTKTRLQVSRKAKCFICSDTSLGDITEDAVSLVIIMFHVSTCQRYGKRGSVS